MSNREASNPRRLLTLVHMLLTAIVYILYSWTREMFPPPPLSSYHHNSTEFHQQTKILTKDGLNQQSERHHQDPNSKL